MRSKTTSNLAIHSIVGWRERLGCCQSRRLTPLGLILMLFALFVPNIASAEIITTTYDFAASVQKGNTTTQFSSNTVKVGNVNCTVYSTLGNVQNPGRFASQNTGMILREATSSSGTTRGLCQTGVGTNQYRTFVINDLYKGDVVTVNGSTTFSLTSGNATANGNTFTMTEKGALGISLAGTQWIYTITVQHDDAAVWGYDPAVETYDLYYNTDGIQSNNLKPAGFPLDYDDYEAQYLTNLTSGTALNDRIAISQVEYNGYYTPWQIDHGIKSLYNWHNISITNLVEGDRVVITWIGSAKFSSKAEQMAYNGCAAFKDNGNDGDFTEGADTYISLGMSLEAKTTKWDGNANANICTSYPYVITENGHLDIALAADSKIVKVVIYGDHQAQMIDRDNQHGTTTSYFNTTGQLEAKQHIVPGGLNVYVGNTENTQHAEVVSSDQGPVSFVYDQSHFKMARTATWGVVNVWQELPATGTYYKFVPEVSGKMWVKFKAVSVKYRDYNQAGNNENIDGNGTPNEYTAAVNCPYYLMVEQDGSFQAVENAHYYSNGANGFFGHFKGDPTEVGNGYGIDVERGKTYYLYGWWQDGTNVSALDQYACGVAELIEVTFLPNQSVTPLAKWVESGTTSDGDLADVKGYNTVKIKKKSANIASCEPYIENGKLKIRNISFVDENKGGGTILIKVGNPNVDADPVFAYTIAYNANYNSQKVGEYKDGDGVTHDLYRTEGHVWNFSDEPLNTLVWNNKNAEADVEPFGTAYTDYFNGQPLVDSNGNDRVFTDNTNSNLYKEMHKTGPDGSPHSDWTFNYRVKKNSQRLDPRFLNNYDMEGDNADMMWDTEGIIINAGSTQSCIFNELGTTVDHGKTNGTPNQIADPDRYVGFLEGGSFIIPKLKKDDRVIVYMGSGNGSGATAMELHIDNARDAMYNEIDPEDFYHAGGSQWNVPEGHNDPNYRGCYHFFAKEDGDMTFTMARGSMCKLYWIRIYRGTRYGTNGVQENGGGYTTLATIDQSGNVTTGDNSWTLHYRGKGETVADGTGKFSQENEVLVHTGNIENLTLGRLSKGQGITYTNQGEIGMLRVRVKCMEYNHNYVTDFADRNLTLALHETQEYPYTWDFTDVDLYSGAGAKAPTNNILGEYENYNEIEEGDQGYTWYEPKGRELSMWDSNGNMILYGPYSDDQATVYTNQNMIFENAKGINGNQLYANGGVIPETKGLWFYFDSNDPSYNGSTQITANGLRLSNTKRTLANGTTTMGWWNTKMVVPDVPSGAAVYARVVRDPSVSVNDYSQKTGEDPVYFLFNKYQFAHMSEKIDIADGTNCRFYKVDDKSAYTASDDDDEYIIAILNTGATSNLTITLNGWIVKKLSVSLDPKAVNVKGWTTESRSRVIDPELTAYLTGYDMETCLVTAFDKTKRKVTLSRVYDPTAESNDALVMRSFTQNGENGANIIHNIDNEQVQILNNGFHLFVPDMHDYLATRSDDFTNEKELTNNDIWRNLLVSQVSAGTIPNKETRTWKYTESDAGTSVECTNYAMSYKYYDVDQAGNIKPGSTLQEGDEAFYRIVIGGASSLANKGYLPIPTADMQVNGLYANMLTVGYEGEETGISDVTNAVNNDVFYTIDGQKLNGVPTISGIYIVNGKKVVIK